MNSSRWVSRSKKARRPVLGPRAGDRGQPAREVPHGRADPALGGRLPGEAGDVLVAVAELGEEPVAVGPLLELVLQRREARPPGPVRRCPAAVAASRRAHRTSERVVSRCWPSIRWYLAIWPGMTDSGTRTRNPRKWRPVLPGLLQLGEVGPELLPLGLVPAVVALEDGDDVLVGRVEDWPRGSGCSISRDFILDGEFGVLDLGRSVVADP